MRNLTSIFLPCTVLAFAGCASGNKTEYIYTQAFDSGVSYQKAIAQCQYEDHLQSRADARAEVDSGRGLLSILAGKPSQTQIYCMKRFGWELQERVAQSLPQPTNKNIQSQNQSTASPQFSPEDSAVIRARRELREHSERYASRCNDISYKAYYSKSPCSIKLTDAMFFSITDKISDDEVIVAKQVFAMMDEYEQHRSIYMKQYGSVRDRIYLSINVRYLPEFQNNRNLLLSRSITWGEYNKTRAELNEKMTKEMNDVPK